MGLAVGRFVASSVEDLAPRRELGAGIPDYTRRRHLENPQQHLDLGFSGHEALPPLDRARLQTVPKLC